MIKSRIGGIAVAAFFMTALPALRVTAIGEADNWSQIARLAGPGGKPEDTMLFATHGGKVRFIVTVQPNSSGPVPFLATMYSKGSPVTPNELHRTQCIDCKGKITDDLGNVRAGSYYMHVITSRPWTLVIEESK